MAKRRRKITRKEIKEPDEFLTISERAFDYVKENLNYFLGGIAAVLIILGAYSGYGWYNDRQFAKANLALSQGMQLFQEAQKGAVPATKEQTAKEATEKSTAKFNQALAKLREVSDHYSGQGAAKIALLYQGHTMFELGRFEEAATVYQKIAGSGQQDDELAQLAMESRARSLEAIEDYQGALEIYRKLADTAGGMNTEGNLISVARCLEALGKKSDALLAYREFLEKHPSSQFTLLAQAKQISLEK